MPTRLGDSIFDRSSEILMTEAATVDSPSQEDDCEDVGCNAELHASRQDAFQGFSSYERSQQQNRLVLTKSSWKRNGEVVLWDVLNLVN